MIPFQPCKRFSPTPHMSCEDPRRRNATTGHYQPPKKPIPVKSLMVLAPSTFMTVQRQRQQAARSAAPTEKPIHGTTMTLMASIRWGMMSLSKTMTATVGRPQRNNPGSPHMIFRPIYL